MNFFKKRNGMVSFFEKRYGIANFFEKHVLTDSLLPTTVPLRRRVFFRKVRKSSRRAPHTRPSWESFHAQHLHQRGAAARLSSAIAYRVSWTTDRRRTLRLAGNAWGRVCVCIFVFVCVCA